MRWESLFADLEAQLNAESVRDRVVEVQEMVRIERSQVALEARLAGHVGGDVGIALGGGLRLRGRLEHVGRGWMAVAEGPAEYLVPAPAVRTLAGVGARSINPGGTGRRLVTLGAALRALVRDRARVTLHSIDGGVLGTGTLDQAGADFVQLASHELDEYRRGAAVRTSMLVPWPALAAVRREA